MLDLFPSHPTCTRCNLHLDVPDNHHVGVPTEATGLVPTSQTPAVIWIGINPGYNEGLKNRPFIGESGKILRNAYIPGHNFDTKCSNYLTNMARCGPDPSVPDASFKACFDYLKEDFHTIMTMHCHARIAVVLLGAQPVLQFHKRMYGKASSLQKSFKNNGRVHETTVLNYDASGSSMGPQTVRYALFATYHPAYCLRKRAMIHAVEDHLTLVSRYIDDTSIGVTETDIIPARYPKC